VIPLYRCYKSLVLPRVLPPRPQVDLVVVGFVRALNLGLTEAAKAREKLNDAEQNLNAAQKHLEEAKEELVDLFDPTGYGAEGEWKKLHNTCLTKDTGEYVLSIIMNIPVSHHVYSYVYEVCLFEEAKQQAKHGGSSFSLGYGSSD